MRHLVHELLDAAAARHPERPAVVDGARVRTYGELARDANRLAHLLIRVGLAPEDRVGIWLDKSVEAVVGIYAVWKAGGA